MRHLIALVLIVCGTVLAMAPVASEFVQREQIAEIASRQDQAGPIKFVPQPLEETYRVGGWILGAAMIGLGIIGVWRHANPGLESGDVSEERYLARAAG